MVVPCNNRHPKQPFVRKENYPSPHYNQFIFPFTKSDYNEEVKSFQNPKGNLTVTFSFLSSSWIKWKQQQPIQR